MPACTLENVSNIVRAQHPSASQADSQGRLKKCCVTTTLSSPRGARGVNRTSCKEAYPSPIAESGQCGRVPNTSASVLALMKRRLHLRS
ncbi:MAG: hypothetical protein FD153_1302 [Rhodospirillaceae bacterium]|nr:MAG: hypothetical protein FD153_1302 [Rhodospirillaceae bacterium]